MSFTDPAYQIPRQSVAGMAEPAEARLDPAHELGSDSSSPVRAHDDDIPDDAGPADRSFHRPSPAVKINTLLLPPKASV